MPVLDKKMTRIAAAIGDAGGRALIVGGFVRDRLLGIDSKDIDIEVYGLSLAELEATLGRFGSVITIGRTFGVLRIKGLDTDFSLPRRDNKTGAGHRGFEVVCDPNLDYASAAARRDLTINSIALDPITEELIDPHGGQRDLENGRLRATDPRHFSEDPLRGLRVAQFAARFNMRPDEELVALCAALDLSELPGERLYEEIRKLLLKGEKPSVGFELMRETGLLRFFPELAALPGVPQDATWHPEGDVWAHTMMVVDAAARLRDGGDDDLTLMFAAVTHDFGKPETTVTGDDGRVRSPAHDKLGVPLTEAFMGRLRASKELTARVCALVQNHLAPALFVKQGTTPRGYRRLARKLEEAGVSMTLLVRLARADHLGRTTDEALAGEFAAGDAFLEQARQLEVEERGHPDVVMGRHLIARGFQPGKGFGEILKRCRELQDEKGGDDADAILDAVLAKYKLANESNGR